MTERTFSYGPVYARDAQVLILGTAPSIASLEHGFYYAHPRNAFWPILFELAGEPLSTDVEAKKRLLIRHKMALWDVAASCIRPGSLDSSIRDAKPNDIPALIADCPGIERILLNGKTTLALFKRFFKSVGVECVCLPSTSPAYTIAYDLKKRAWAQYIPPRENA